MRCPDCGARNTASAAFCTQCLRRFGTEDPECLGDRAAQAVTEAPGSTTDEASSPPSDEGGGDRPFRTMDGEVEWRCDGCGEWNPLLVPQCAICGRPLAGADRGAQQRERVARTRRLLWGVAAVLCIVAVVVLVLFLSAMRGVG